MESTLYYELLTFDERTIKEICSKVYRQQRIGNALNATLIAQDCRLLHLPRFPVTRTTAARC